ncbi:MAG: NIPSNAP family protein [Candidatus Hydrogenedentes bacterium]|nr:NIPSNAP family protein [Candidatus Hydrogenedentota bacterium]
MKSILASALVVSCAISAFAADTRCYELRIYHAAPGKLDALNARFKEHSCALLEKHGFTNVGYWVPVDNKDNLLIYVISSPSREAHDKAWKEFAADPEWKEVVKTTEANGKLATKVDSIYLTATDFSPEVKIAASEPARAFELRTYTPAEGKMDALLSRFRDHTVKLFEKHGMTNVAYWTSTGVEKPQLIYILAHKSKEDGLKSFGAFRVDPEWVEAKKASEANGSLTEKVESVYMTPVDYSQLK